MQGFFAPFWWKRFLTIFSICCVKYCKLGRYVCNYLIKKREIQMCITSCPNIFATRWFFVNLSCRVSKLSLKIWTKKFFTVNLEFLVFESQNTEFQINFLIKGGKILKVFFSIHPFLISLNWIEKRAEFCKIFFLSFVKTTNF